MHARAAAKFVHLATRYESRVRVARDGREMDGKSIMGMLLLAAARGSTITISRRRRRRAATRSTALVGAGASPDSARTYAAPEAASASRPASSRAARSILIQRAQVLRYQIAPARVDHELRAARREPRCGRASSSSTSSARVARRRGRELASLFDAQLLMLDDPMLRAARRRDRPRAARQRRVGGAAGVPRVQRGVRRGRRSRTCASGRATSPIWSAGCG